MDKYIGFDIDDKKTVACVIETGKKERFQKMDNGNVSKVDSISILSKMTIVS